MIRNISIFILAIALAALSHRVYAGGQVGTWKNYMAYNKVTWIEKNGKTLYVLASNNLYTFNESDNSLQVYDKVNGLSDSEIKFIGWNTSARKLVIVYANQNIDLIDDKGNITNIPDFNLRSMIEDKTVNDLNMDGRYCYLSTGFGILKLDVLRGEINNTYNLGINVKYSYIQGNYIYAASKASGIYRGELSQNLLDKSNWLRISDFKDRSKHIDKELLAKVQKLNPGGPKYNKFYYMTFLNDRLYSAGGAFESEKTIVYQNPGTVQILKNNEWTIYQDDIAKQTGYAYEDQNCLAVDPSDPEHVFVGGRTGLYEFQAGVFKKAYNLNNSLLKSAVIKTSGGEIEGGSEYVLINGIAFDKNRNLWILNSQTYTTSILKLSPSGEMTSHHQSELNLDGIGLPVMKAAMVDSRGLLWFTNANYKLPALFCYQPEKGGFNVYKRFVNQDGTIIPTTEVSCVTEDKYGNLWVGTSLGPLLLHAADIGSSTEVSFEQVKVPRNDGTNLADYLLSGVSISCMAIDGGGRKWFGTPGAGVYLISEDNMEQIHHFTASNSALLSDFIESIAINDKTGEVFFGTDKGLCSFMSGVTASVEDMTSDGVYAYPNPVKPGYHGEITIVGLAHNADVKIVTTNGVLVAQGTSIGGSYVWNGKDLSGKRVASGVYIVQVATQEGKNGVVCKVAVVN